MDAEGFPDGPEVGIVEGLFEESDDGSIKTKGISNGIFETLGVALGSSLGAPEDLTVGIELG